MRIKLTVEYDGTDYCGWQIQKNGLSVQQVIEDCLYNLTSEKIKITGSGRTDAGVHAKGQVAHFDTESTIPPEKFAVALNVLLPADIKVIKSEKVSGDFNARKSTKKKTYSYTVYRSEIPRPLKERYALMTDKNLDIPAMKSAAKLFVGEHDFISFCASGSSVKTTVRTIYSLSVKEKGEDVIFTVTGGGFLYNMVRIIVGTLLKVGEGKASEKDIELMLSGKNRSLGGKTLPAKGLCLEKVVY